MDDAKRVLQPTTSVSGLNYSPTSKRSKVVKALIYKAHVIAGRLAPEPHELDLLAHALEYAIDDVPTEHLEECFKRAVKAKTDNYVVSGTDIRNQWLEYRKELARLIREEEERREARRQAPGVCRTCKGNGWLVDRRKPSEPQAVRCYDCDGRLRTPYKPPSGPLMTFNDWVVLHKAKHPEGCDKQFCIVCYPQPATKKAGGWPVADINEDDMRAAWQAQARDE